MNSLKTLLLGTAVFGTLCCAVSPRPLQAAEAQWESLFNGMDLSGWTKVYDVTAEVKDGHLRISKGMGWLRTEKQYRDFVFECDWRALDKDYDSGIFLRAGLEGKPWPKEGWQVNLRQNGLGSLVKGYKTIVPSETPKMPLNEWVKFRIEVKGKKATLTVNGEKAWEYDAVDAERGYLGIQIEDKAFDFRNIRVMPLETK